MLVSAEKTAVVGAVSVEGSCRGILNALDAETEPVVRKLLGAELDLGGFARFAAAADPVLARLASVLAGFRPPLAPDPFEALVGSITAQQVSLFAAFAIRSRLIERFGARVGRVYAFPTRERLAAAARGRAGAPSRDRGRVARARRRVGEPPRADDEPARGRDLGAARLRRGPEDDGRGGGGARGALGRWPRRGSHLRLGARADGRPRRRRAGGADVRPAARSLCGQRRRAAAERLDRGLRRALQPRAGAVAAPRARALRPGRRRDRDRRRGGPRRAVRPLPPRPGGGRVT